VLRHQLAAYSPLDLAAIRSGFRALTSAGGREATDLVERTLVRHFGSRGLLLTDSGTSALALALRHTGADRSRPVALPAYGCYDLATATVAADVPFRFYDIDPLTLGPDLDSLRRALQDGADRIVVVHLFGIPVDMRPVESLAREFGALVVEDAAQGAGASLQARPVGSFGSLGVLSFNRGKGVTAGRGGALLANDDAGLSALGAAKAALDARSGRVLGDMVALLGQWALARPSLYWLPASLPFLGLGETIYRPPHPPTGPTPFSLGVLQRALTLADQEAQARRRNAAVMEGVLQAPCTPIRLSVAGGLAGFLRLPFLAGAEWNRRLESPAARRLGIARGYPRALADLPGFADRARPSAEELPGARLLAARLFTLPTHGALQERDLRALGAWFAEQSASPAG
jgi:perosamine synthetase